MTTQNELYQNGIKLPDMSESTKITQQMKQAFEMLPTPVIIYDLDDHLVYFNKAYSNFFSYMPALDELLGKHFFDVIKFSMDAKGVVYDPLLRKDPNAYRQMRLERLHNPSHEAFEQHTAGRWHLVTEYKIEDLGYFSIRQDITAAKRSAEALSHAEKEIDISKQANQAKSEFLAAMSHELRTPLNAILGFSDILFKQYFGAPGAGKYREYAKDIHDSGQHLLALVNDLLDISTIEAGEKSLEKEMLPIREIVKDCGRIIDEKMQAKNIDFITEVMNGHSMFYADKRASKQILINILWNAVKFTPEGGEISIFVKASSHHTNFTITDTGVGIPADHLSNITKPFSRSDNNPHVSDDGWGLGLSITKSLVELHDGDMNISSEVGKGTIVTVTFPNQERISE